MAKRRPQTIKIEETVEGRFVVRTFDDGEIIRVPVALDAKPTRKPRRPFQRAKVPHIERAD